MAAPRLEIDASEGTLVLACDGSMSLVTDSDCQQWQFTQDTLPESHIAAQQHFIDCLESGAQFETSGAETLKTMALVYACYRSATEGRVVDPKALRL
jgi:predicted dehydrogenase